MTLDCTNEFRMLIGGSLRAADKSISVENPANLDVVGPAPDASEEDVECAILAARQAFPDWAATPIDERRQKILELADRIADHVQPLSKLLTSEQGKPLHDADREVLGMVAWLKGAASLDLPVTVNEDSAERYSETRHVPLGVVAAIAPWNYPLLLASFKIGPALLAGNTIVLKPSPYTPLATLKIGEIAADIFPAGVFNVISGSDRLGPWLTQHSDVDKISFTGSTAVGKAIMAGAAKQLTRLTLELGGNDAAIVMPDVNVDEVAEAIFWAALGNNGQICLAAKRLYIHETIYDELRDTLVGIANSLQIGDGMQPDTQIGPINNQRQYDRIVDLLGDAKQQGLEVLSVGHQPTAKGYFHPIIFVDNPSENSSIVQEEQFGPIVPLIKVKDMDEAVSRCNASEYGLGASIWGSNLSAAWTLAEKIESGTVCINEARHLSPLVSFSGMKQSGFGIENGLEGLLEFTTPKTMTLRRTAPDKT